MFNGWSVLGFILTKIAKAQGYLDPRLLFSQLQRFSKPSEVWVPAELLRSGMVLQARGLINSQAIQNNLDWVWPFWVTRQFNPKDVAFISRAFNLVHINLTHRNWTALGLPGYNHYPLVDPRGLVMPFLDGWSLDAWIIKDDGTGLIPSQLPDVYQQIRFEKNLQVVTFSNVTGMSLHVTAETHHDGGIPTCRVSYYAHSDVKAWLWVCVRPYNTEGISLIDLIERRKDGEGWIINSKEKIHLNEAPWHYLFSNYQIGDLLEHVDELSAGAPGETQEMRCAVGMATGAAVYELVPHRSKEVVLEVPLMKEPPVHGLISSWGDHLNGCCKLDIPDRQFQDLYEIALRTLVLHSPAEIYPGPYTYKRFWFRDAAYIIYAMLCAGLTRNLEKIINTFPKRQKSDGYYESQDGEWDSNGQALWAMERCAKMIKIPMSLSMLTSVQAGAKWIKRKRVSAKVESGHAGLLPAGFSAEHFGPSDFYYWDDYWGVAGLHSAAYLIEPKDSQLAGYIREEAQDLHLAIENSLEKLEGHLEGRGIPASPYRRMDAGAVGSLVSSYPLQIYKADDKRILATVEFVMKKYLLNGTYYHELSHAGINIYLTLQIAQVLLRAGDKRFFDMVSHVADLATPTGQWPEAIHPQTKGGCMGDGQHVWAAAEWVMMMRNMFVREEEHENTVILCSGIPKSWLKKKQRLFFGPTNTTFGPISVTIELEDVIRIHWDAAWHGKAPIIEIRLNGHKTVRVHDENIHSIELSHSTKEALR